MIASSGGRPRPIQSAFGAARNPIWSPDGKFLLFLGNRTGNLTSPVNGRQSYDETVVAGRQLPRRTSATIVDPLKFFEHVRTVAGQGFALDFEECEEGLNCVAVPVYGRDGHVVAALSISGPAFRLGTDRCLRNIVPAVSESAAQLSHDLGFSSG